MIRSPCSVIFTFYLFLLLVLSLNATTIRDNYVMLFSLHTTLHFFSFSYVVYLCQDLLTLTMNGSSWFYDFTVRVNQNDTVLNSFNFFWTSFTYLPTFFFGIFFLYYICSSKQLVTTIIIFFVVYNTELFDMIAASSPISSNNLSRTSINLLLLNSLNKYHPFVFYISVYSVLTLLLRSNCILCPQSLHSFRPNVTLLYFRKQCRRAVNFNLTALFMGSWWALQEGTWGGWWNWDPSEVFGLMFGLTALWLQHSLGTYLSFTKVLTKFIQLTIITILTYFFIQLNFDLVSHNFGAKFFFFFNNNLFFIEAIMFLSISYLMLYRRLAMRDFELHHFKPLTFHKWVNLPGLLFLTPALTLVISILTVFSFLPLINYFLWNFLGINTFNGFRDYTNWVLIFLFIIIAPFYKVPVAAAKWQVEVGCTYLTAFITSSPILVHLFLVPIKLTSTRVIHVLIVYFLLFNTLSSCSDFITWGLDEEDQILVLSGSLFSSQTYIYSCSGEFVYSHSTRLNEQNLPLFTSGVFYMSNSLTLQPFLLIFNSQVFTNVYNLSLNWVSSNIYIESTFISNAYDFLLPLLVFQQPLLAL